MFIITICFYFKTQETIHAILFSLVPLYEIIINNESRRISATRDDFSRGVDTPTHFQLLHQIYHENGVKASIILH